MYPHASYPGLEADVASPDVATSCITAPVETEAAKAGGVRVVATSITE